jgi:hypothetical protein
MNPYNNQQPPPPHRLHQPEGNNNGMESNFPQHTQAPLPYPGYPTYNLPNLNYSPSNPPFDQPYPRTHPTHQYPPNTSPPYDRYPYAPNIPSRHGPSLQTPGPRRRESENERHGMGSVPAGSRPAPEAPEPRMGQYMAYNQQSPYEWPIPGSSQRDRQPRSKPPNEQGADSNDLRETVPSRPGSPTKPIPLKTEIDDDEDEEKMDHRKRKRNRTIRSCVPCHNHKRKVRFGSAILALNETRVDPSATGNDLVDGVRRSAW